MSYNTKQSKLVYDFLQNNPHKHFSAEEVYFALISNGDNIGRTTVYRQLDKLCDEGKLENFSLAKTMLVVINQKVKIVTTIII